MSNLYNFTPDQGRQDASSPDLSRPDATEDEYISLKEALEIFISEGRDITERTLQRYCKKQQLDGQKRITAEGEKWFVRRSSVYTCIKELEEFDKLRASRPVATGHGKTGPDAEQTQNNFANDQSRQAPTDTVSSPVVALQPSHSTSNDQSRLAASGRDWSEGSETSKHKNTAGLSDAERELYERLLSVIEEQRADLLKDKELPQADKDALLQQLLAKDKQIDRFFESERDTKTLAGRFQSLISGLWPKKAGESGEHYVPMHEALDSGLEGQDRKDHDR